MYKERMEKNEKQLKYERKGRKRQTQVTNSHMLVLALTWLCTILPSLEEIWHKEQSQWQVQVL